MDNKKTAKGLQIFAVFFGVFVLILGGFVTYYNTPAYSQGYNIGIGVASPNLAFSFGEGVNAYYAPTYGGYLYGYNGSYYRWYNDGWFYANTYGGPWFPVTAGIYLPGILTFGPPPPVVAYSPYFTWWRNNIGPWYRYHHPGWWGRHHMYLRNYNVWREHEGRFYNNHPYQNWRMRRPFGNGRPAYRGQVQKGPIQQRLYHPSQQGRSNNIGRVQQRGYMQGRPAVRKGPAHKGSVKKDHKHRND
ncbi:MAG: hypothetical protein ACYCSQ_03530 [bacterium]